MLALPALAYRDVQHNLAATPGVGSVGTTVTGGVANTKGASWTTLIAATNFDVEWITLLITNTALAATQTDALLDIGIGSAGNEIAVLPNLLAGWAGRADAGPRTVTLPVRISAGTRISGRCQGVQASKAVAVCLWLYGGAGEPAQPTLSRADALGVTSAAASNGTSVTPGNTGTEGSWTNIGSTTARDYKALLLMVQGTLTVTTMNALAYHWEVGWNSITYAEFLTAHSTNEVTYGPLPSMPIFLPVPAATQLQVRGECSGTAQVFDVALYGLY